MIVGMYALRLIEASDGNQHPIAQDFFVHRQRASALGTKASLCVPGRSVSRRLAIDPAKRCDREVNKCQRRRARVPSAHRAMANHAANGSGGCAVANGSAEAAAFE